MKKYFRKTVDYDPDKANRAVAELGEAFKDAGIDDETSNRILAALVEHQFSVVYEGE